MAPAKKVTTPMPGAQNVDSKSVKKFPKNPPKGDVSSFSNKIQHSFSHVGQFVLQTKEEPFDPTSKKKEKKISIRCIFLKLVVVGSFCRVTAQINESYIAAFI